MLNVDKVGISFGGVVALHDITFRVEPGAIVGLIGPNGAGKTTILNCISRFYEPSSGQISMGGVSLLAAGPHELQRHGIARTFQHLQLFSSMTVMENLLIGQQADARAGLFANLIRSRAARAEERTQRERALEVLSFLGIAQLAESRVDALPYGTRKLVDLGRALVRRPRLLLLDEPAAGLPHERVEGMGDLILRIREELQTAMLLIEHHMSIVMRVSDRVCVLQFGRTIAEGTPREVQQDPRVIEAYLGEGERMAG